MYSIRVFLAVLLALEVSTLTKQVRVAVKNETPLTFRALIEYSGTLPYGTTTWKPMTENIPPYPSNVVILSFSRNQPIGEHIYTVYLVHGNDRVPLRHRLISLTHESLSELSIGVGDSYLSERSFILRSMNKDMKKVFFIDGHQIAVSFDIKNFGNNEVVAYEFREEKEHINDTQGILEKCIVAPSTKIPPKNSAEAIPMCLRMLADTPRAPWHQASTFSAAASSNKLITHVSCHNTYFGPCNR